MLIINQKKAFEKISTKSNKFILKIVLKLDSKIKKIKSQINL